MKNTKYILEEKWEQVKWEQIKWEIRSYNDHEDMKNPINTIFKKNIKSSSSDELLSIITKLYSPEMERQIDKYDKQLSFLESQINKVDNPDRQNYDLDSNDSTKLDELNKKIKYNANRKIHQLERERSILHEKKYESKVKIGEIYELIKKKNNKPRLYEIQEFITNDIDPKLKRYVFNNDIENDPDDPKYNNDHEHVGLCL